MRFCQAKAPSRTRPKAARRPPVAAASSWSSFSAQILLRPCRAPRQGESASGPARARGTKAAPAVTARLRRSELRARPSWTMRPNRASTRRTTTPTMARAAKTNTRSHYIPDRSELVNEQCLCVIGPPGPSLRHRGIVYVHPPYFARRPWRYKYIKYTYS